MSFCACSFYALLSPLEQQRLEETAVVKAYATQQLLEMRSFVPYGKLWSVCKGCVRTKLSNADGRTVELMKFQAGYCGIMALYPEKNEYYISVEVEADTLILIADCATIDWIRVSNERFGAYYDKSIADQMMEMVALVGDLQFFPLKKRLMKYIMSNCDEARSTMSITHGELADYLGTSREVISRLLKSLEAEGYVTQKRGTLVINRSDKPKG